MVLAEATSWALQCVQCQGFENQPQLFLKKVGIGVCHGIKRSILLLENCESNSQVGSYFTGAAETPMRQQLDLLHQYRTLKQVEYFVEKLFIQ